MGAAVEISNAHSLYAVGPSRQCPGICGWRVNRDETFTQGDLHASNIIMTPSKPYHILAIIDWEQSDGLPAYWEARRHSLLLTGMRNGQENIC